MKNLIHLGIEKLSNVPIEHLSDRPTQAKKAQWFGYKYDRGWYKLGKTSPWTIVARVIENNIGKPFDMAFSYYCKLVPKMYQKEFLEEFEDNRSSGASYITDDEGNIQDNPNNRWKGRYKRRINNPKGLFSFKSDDYESELRHKVTGHKKKDFEAVYEKRRVYLTDEILKNPYYHYPYRDGKLLYYEYGSDFGWKAKPKHLRYIAQDSDFEAVITKGWEKLFETKNDPEYKRLMNERRKKKDIAWKREQKLKDEKIYDMISKTELQKIKDKELDKQKILAHGFDLVTRFRTEKQTNPDLIKLKQ